MRENKGNFGEIQTAAVFFIFNRVSFSGTTEAVGFSEQAVQKRFTDSSIERLKVTSVLLENVKITYLDYEKVILANGEEVFLDPRIFPQ